MEFLVELIDPELKKLACVEFACGINAACATNCNVVSCSGVACSGYIIENPA